MTTSANGGRLSGVPLQPEGQALAFKNFYRAWDTSAADPADVARFLKLDLVDIQPFRRLGQGAAEHFGDGGIFDQIYTGNWKREGLPCLRLRSSRKPRCRPAPVGRHHADDAVDRRL